jgi:hypothetical protein
MTRCCIQSLCIHSGEGAYLTLFSCTFPRVGGFGLISILSVQGKDPKRCADNDGHNVDTIDGMMYPE